MYIRIIIIWISRNNRNLNPKTIMKLYCITNKDTYEVNIPQGKGEYYTICPVCSYQRKPKNQKKRCFGWNRDKNIGHCSHCNSSFVEFHESEKSEKIIVKNEKFQTTQQINYINPKYLSLSHGLNSNFGDFLKHNFNEGELNEIMKKYYLGMTKDRSVIFWYIDKEERVRSGKIIQYDSQTVKRVKSEKSSITWVHSELKKQNQLPRDWTFSRCLFGEHLLKNNPNANICLVESEKTAIIASIYMPNEIWLATGGKEMFNENVCKVLKGRKVIIFPDLGATKVWREKSEIIFKQVGCTMIISEILERLANEEDKEKGLDIADYLLKLD
jgi:hypothetical protein